MGVIWMDEKRLFLLALPDEATERSLTDVHAALLGAGICDSPEPEFPFHLTLADFALEDEQAALERAREVCAKTPAFDLQLSNIGMFGLKVLFIAPAPNRELLALHDALMPEAEAVGAHQWVPHITMMLDMPEESVLDAVKLVADAFVPAAAHFSRVAAYEFAPARLVGVFDLAGKA